MSVESIKAGQRWRDFMTGARASVPIIIAVLPFGLLFGALAIDNGLSTFETVLMSATVFGGASQMVGIELFGQKVAPWLFMAGVAALALVLVPGFGREVNGARRWLDLPGFGFQPSEAMKLAVVLYAAGRPGGPYVRVRQVNQCGRQSPDYFSNYCDFDLAEFPSIRAWLNRVVDQPGHVPMDWHPAAAAVAG